MCYFHQNLLESCYETFLKSLFEHKSRRNDAHFRWVNNENVTKHNIRGTLTLL